MRLLTKDEIRFVKETHFTPTVYQCDEYDKTPFKDFDEAVEVAKNKYNIDLNEFIDKNLNVDNDDGDGISLEYVATYLFYCFFTKEELSHMTDEEATKFLKDYRYYNGFRKWDDGNLIYVIEAIEVYNGEKVFYLEDDANVWNIEADSPWLKENKDKILKIS